MKSLIKTLLVVTTGMLVMGAKPLQSQTPIAAWDLTGESNVATSTAEVKDSNLTAGSGVLTRGTGAAASTGNNSFRTTGFQNNGIATTNTDYFQTTLQAATGYTISLSTLDAKFAGTATYAASPGVSSQFAYSLDGTNFTLLGSPSVTVGTPATLTQISLTGISALQNVPSSTTITLRYYASGQTATGGWGFNSPASGQYGFAIGGTVAGAAAPAIASFAPTSGWTGDSVVITGTNFTGATAVSFNGTAAASFTVDSDTQITAVVATGTTTGKISVTGPAGTGQSASDFTMSNPNAPTISGFAPATGWTGDTVVISGTHFTGATMVSFNGTAAASFTVDSATQISAVVGTGTTTGKILVTTPEGSVQSATDFTMVDPMLPRIDSFAPPSGWDLDTVTITGVNFTGATNVTFNNVVAYGYTVDSDTQITAQAPVGVTTGKIRVTVGANVAVSATDFTAVNPNILSITVTPSTFAENAGAMTGAGTVSRVGPGTAELIVTLASSDTSEVTVPATVTIPANETSATFDVTAVDDVIPDGAQSVSLTASAAGYTSGTTTPALSVTDDGDAWPIVISQYYEGASSDKYIELHNTSASPLDLTGFRLTSWTNASAEGWKTGTGSPTNNVALPTYTIPAGGYYLLKGSGAANPAYAATTANTTSSAVGGYNGNDSVVLYYGTVAVASIVDAFSCTNTGNEAADKSFYRLTNGTGYDLTAGTSVLTYPTVWASKTMAEVGAAAPTDAWYLQADTLPTAPALSTFLLANNSATSSSGRVTLNYTYTGGAATHYMVSELSDFSGATWQTLATGLTVNLSPGTGTKTVYFKLKNDIGESAPAIDTIEVQTYVYNPTVLITQYYDPDVSGADNKYIEITNVSASPVNMTGWVLARWTNQDTEKWKVTGFSATTPSASIALDSLGTLAAGQTVVVAHTSAAALTPPAALTSGNVNHNGNDAYVLYSGAVSTETIVDAVSFTELGNEGADKSFVRLNNNVGFAFAAGSKVTDFPSVWQDTTLATVGAATSTQNAYLGTYPGSAGGTYGDWIAGYPGVGVQTGFGQDPDGDGVRNGLEHYLATDPSAPSTGVTVTGGTGTSVTFTHRCTESLGSDVTGTYEWSTDLTNWHASDASAGGVTVHIGTSVNAAPSGYDEVTVTGSVTSGTTDMLFLRLKVTGP